MKTLPLGCWLAAWFALSSSLGAADFAREVRPILARHCFKCHGADRQEAGLRLDARKFALAGGDSSRAWVAGSSEQSLLVKRISSTDPDEVMPPEGARLAATEIESIRNWIDSGAEWPESDADRIAERDPRRDHWAWQPIKGPAIPRLNANDTAWARTPIDAFIVEKLRAQGLAPSPEADRHTLIRRLYFDLLGLPPQPHEVENFVKDDRPQAYELLVDRLLDSPHYGERWARHWLDVARYADTHGYDKDKPRANAWPYRDYVIRAFNTDKPYGRFVEEQLAGDMLYPETTDGIEALGFISAGPWDFIGHVEVPEHKTDGKIARLLDRDDMVSNAMNTFTSLTVQCARCHNHKFDPVSQEDYYSLQAVFAALDRADRVYDPQPELAARRKSLRDQRDSANTRIAAAKQNLNDTAAKQVAQLDSQIAELQKTVAGTASKVAAYGYHSRLANSPETVKWVQVDLGKSLPLGRVVLHGCLDNFNNIGAGFGFPVRFKVELGDDPMFLKDVTCIADYNQTDFANPKLQPVEILVNTQPARFVRITATRLALRQNDYMFALAELDVFDTDGRSVAQAGAVQSLDSIEAPPRWRMANLVDRYAPGVELSTDPEGLKRLQAEREQMFQAGLEPTARESLARATRDLADVERQIAKLPPEQRVYVGTVHRGNGNFRGTGLDGGKPRVVHVLRRGDVNDPQQVVGPGAVPIVAALPARFDLSEFASEGDRRAALAKWITEPRNPLTWRSIVNRVWHYHFGRGLVETPNDFGRMGSKPSHPELLDWLAADFRDSGQSLKSLHRKIVTSSVFRQSSAGNPQYAAIDGSNQFLWRMNRRRLEAEAIRDSVLAVAGQLDTTPGGPGYQDFVIEQPAHSPHYEYHLHDPTDRRAHRRSIYRFIVRSQPQPFMTTLDCADPAMSVDKRNESLTALQALALLNNRFMLLMSERFAARLSASGETMSGQINEAYRLALARSPSDIERLKLIEYASKHGMPSACRVLLNLSEFVFVE